MEIFWINFINPECLILILLWVFFSVLFYNQKSYWIKFYFLDDIKKIFGKINFLFYLRLIFIFLIFVSFSLLLSNPNKIEKNTKINKKWIDIIVLFDVSYSMMAEDLKPNRLELAKIVLLDFSSKLESDRLGLILFSGKPFTSMPLSFDYEIISEFISSMEIWVISQNNRELMWTAIWDAMLMGIDAFKDSKDREKVIILMTDGEANKWIAPLISVKLAKEKGIKIYSVWIGAYWKTYVDIPNLFGRTQRVEIWWVDEKTLKDISRLTSWEYFRASDDKTFKEIFETISKLEKKDLEKEETVYIKTYSVFVYYILFFLLSYTFLLYYLKLRD